MTRLDLPSGGWVEWRDPAAVTEKQRRPFRSKMLALSKQAQAGLAKAATDPGEIFDAMQPGDVEILWEINDIVAATMVDTASFVEGRPCTPDDIAGLTGPDYEAVVAGSAPFASTFTGVDFAPNNDERTATNPT